MVQGITQRTEVDTRQDVSVKSEVTQAVICPRVVEFRGTNLEELIASVVEAQQSGQLSHLPDCFTIRVCGGELSPASHRSYLARP